MSAHNANTPMTHGVDDEGASGRRAVILMCHGSRNDGANDAHRSLCDALSVRLGTTVWPAFLELTEPRLSAAIQSCVGAGATNVGVLPYFLHPGNHTSKDIPELIEEARVMFPDVEIHIGGLFGADSTLVDILATQINRLFEE